MGRGLQNASEFLAVKGEGKGKGPNPTGSTEDSERAREQEWVEQGGRGAECPPPPELHHLPTVPNKFALMILNVSLPRSLIRQGALSPLCIMI